MKKDCEELGKVNPNSEIKRAPEDTEEEKGGK